MAADPSYNPKCQFLTIWETQSVIIWVDWDKTQKWTFLTNSRFIPVLVAMNTTEGLVENTQFCPNKHWRRFHWNDPVFSPQTQLDMYQVLLKKYPVPLFLDLPQFETSFPKKVTDMSCEHVLLQCHYVKSHVTHTSVTVSVVGRTVSYQHCIQMTGLMLLIHICLERFVVHCGFLVFCAGLVEQVWLPSSCWPTHE